MIKNNQINIRHFTGVSSGAYVSLFTLLDIPMYTIRNMYEFAKKNTEKYNNNNPEYYILAPQESFDLQGCPRYFFQQCEIGIFGCDTSS